MDSAQLRRSIAIALTVVILNLVGLLAFGADGLAIFDVRKTLPLDSNEPVYHDYYINGGPESGLNRGLYVSVIRIIPVHDPVQNKAQADMRVEVARLKIIHSEKNISVGRLAKGFGAEDRPTLDFPVIMIGDRIDVSKASMEGTSGDGSKGESPKGDDANAEGSKSESSSQVADPVQPESAAQAAPAPKTAPRPAPASEATAPSKKTPKGTTAKAPAPPPEIPKPKVKTVPLKTKENKPPTTDSSQPGPDMVQAPFPVKDGWIVFEPLESAPL
jgi:hypothetical protein